MKKSKDELTRAASIVALRHGIVKASLLLGNAKNPAESHLLVTFIGQAAHYMEKLKSSDAGSVDIKIGSLIKHRKIVSTMKERARVSTIRDLMASPLHDFYSALFSKSFRDVDSPTQQKKEGVAKSLYKVLSAMHPNVIVKSHHKTPSAKS